MWPVALKLKAQGRGRAVRKLRQTIIKPSSKTLTLPNSMELPYLADSLPDSQTFNEDFSTWWERVRAALQFAWEGQLVGGLERDVKETTDTLATSVEEVLETAQQSFGPGGSGGTPSTSTAPSWDGGVVAQQGWNTRADGGMAGPRIFAMDGGSPTSTFTYAVQPEVNDVDHSGILDLIEGTHSGGTP